MKIREGYIMRKVADEIIVVPTGTASAEFNGIITLNATAGVIWDGIENGYTTEEIVQHILINFDIDEKTAFHDVTGVIHELIEMGLIQE